MSNDVNSAILVLEEQKSNLLEQINKIDDVINQLRFTSNYISQSTTNIEQKNNNQNMTKAEAKAYSELSWDEKIVDAIKNKNRFLHSREILEFIKGKDKSIKEDDKVLLNNISGALWRLKTKSIVAKYQHDNNNRNTFWGSTKWLDENEKIIKGYEYDEEQIYKKNVLPMFDF